ncbi:MAG: alkaline phosphatase family protein [Bacteroidia bacterium]|nr:alkaline phosphatase family protein [Bacteroidia bacterium]NNF31620.1 tetratricopeptide repeat protein [Flavobacteriaceae bacterium]MBT8275278.1 alkaline phosphatase family protein [Bacteroidia bacterium]NNJ83256.1 tetratricopeptide repeat protein [Flavobacteriaceae bacterium]NNK53310.1 tetratricopeptide repeat protein [Flavobacteriaceae bacterium]
MKKNKLLLIGWDAADWKIIGPMLAQGLMPSLKKLIDNGVYGNMSTMNPPYSPMLWSTVATGKTPDKHGVLGFVEVVPNKKALRPVTANSRKARAIWNILHHEGYTSNVVGWWPSFPAEPINGVVVTDKFQRVSADPKQQRGMQDGTIHPEHLKDDLKELRMFPWEITHEHFLPFMPDAAKIDQDDKNNGLIPFSKILTQNVSLHNASTYLLRETEWDFMAVYFDMIDHFCHSFMKYHPPKLDGVRQEFYDLYKGVVTGAYRFQDMMLGRVLSLIDDDTTVIIMSDHGFESGNKRILAMPKVAAAPALDHRQFGIFVASGPNIKKNEKIFGASLIDVAPTILHHFGLPVGKDMDGKIIMDMYQNPSTPSYIDSWEDVKGDFAELEKEERDDILSDEETMEQLIELGYIERPDDKIETSIHKTKCELKHNLARVYLGKKDYEKAKSILLELLEEKPPINLAPYYVDIMTVYIGLEDYESAETYLEAFKKVKTPVNYNIYFIEADILLGNGYTKKALKVLEEARDLKPNAEVHYRIGNIQFILQNFQIAKECFEQAIELDQDRAKYHKAMSDTMLELQEYEEAAEYAFTSIELVKYYPAAHYALGRALEKLGDLENAKLAYETSARLTAKTYSYREEKALENIEEKIKTPLELRDKNNFKYRDNQIIIVSGLPRSGTSLMMQMMDKGGVECLVDDKREADESNPKGYYEFEPVMSLHKDNTWMDQAQNKAVKIVAPLLNHIDGKYRYKVVFMTRDLDEVLKSQQKMIGKNPDVLPVKLYNKYRNLLKFVDSWKENEPGIELIYIDYGDVLENPSKALNDIESFIGIPLNKKEMTKCIDKSLHRNRVTSTEA